MSGKKSCHFIGIGGIGMSALARLLLEEYCVSGSDLISSDVVEELKKQGAHIHIGHAEEHIPKEASIVVYSSDISPDNPEWKMAKERGVLLLHRSELLAQLTQGKHALAVSGTHGKTTTTSLLASVLIDAGHDPSFTIGGILNISSTNGHGGKGPFFIFEADESDGSFLHYFPEGAILTNIDNDHLNYYKSCEAIARAFAAFAKQVKHSSLLFWCHDDPRLCSLHLPGSSYGFHKEASLRITHAYTRNWRSSFSCIFEGKVYENIDLSLIGTHNILNAAAVFGLSLRLGISEEKIRHTLSTFAGVKRRMERKSDLHDILVLDDYAHHPTAIKMTIHALRQSIRERRLLVVFEPHRYSRIQSCLSDFKECFSEADKVFITDIYAAREAKIPDISIETLKQIAVASYLPEEEWLSTLLEEVSIHDVILFMGAGNITKKASLFAERMKNFKPKKLKIAVLAGGQSHEHEVSLVSAQNVYQGLDRNLYDPSLIILPKESAPLPNLRDVDVVLPMMHGPKGEDGMIYAWLELIGTACTGCNYQSASIAMEKDLTKKLIQAASIPTQPFLSCTHTAWHYMSSQEKEVFFEKIHDTLSYPLFIKPCHLGSSIGVGKVNIREELSSKIEAAFKVDDKIIIEQGILHPRELEFAVFGNHFIEVFPPGEVLTEGNFYDYNAKYSTSGFSTTVDPKDLSESFINEGMELAKKVYLTLGCQGFARIDFLMDMRGTLWCNEVNPIPGFTHISLYPKICARHGLSTASFLQWLIILALHKKRYAKNPT